MLFSSRMSNSFMGVRVHTVFCAHGRHEAENDSGTAGPMGGIKTKLSTPDPTSMMSQAPHPKARDPKLYIKTNMP